MHFSIDIQPDDEGYTGRECPECEKYFKIELGTGIEDATDCHCPYCNHFATYDHFWTKQQIEYAQSVAMNQISGEFIKQMKRLERKPDRNAFISLGVEVKGKPTRIFRYSEAELEAKIVCDQCTLNYTIYGTFGFCPDCGVHNSRQIVEANFDIVLQMLDLANNASEEIASKLIENCLEDAVSAFDGFGREHCKEIPKISFQNLVRARERVRNHNGIDLATGMSPDQWDFVSEQFQKRHLLAHTMGVIDQDFIDKTNCPPSLLGKKVDISISHVRSLVSHLRILYFRASTETRQSRVPSSQLIPRMPRRAGLKKTPF